MRNISIWILILPFLFLGCSNKSKVNEFRKKNMNEVCVFHNGGIGNGECQGFMYPNAGFKKRGVQNESVELTQCRGGLKSFEGRKMNVPEFMMKRSPCRYYSR